MAREDHVIHLENGRLAGDTPRARVARMSARAVAGGHLVLHFHGGLVDYAAGMDIVDRLLPRYTAAGADPLFFVWESGLLETLGNNFSEIAGERLFRILWKRIAAIARRKFGQSAGQRAAFVLPALDAAELEQAVDRALDSGDAAHLRASEATAPGDLEELGDFERMALENELLLDAQLTMEIQQVSNGLRPPAEIALDMQTRSATVRASTHTLMDPRAVERLVERPEAGHRGLFSAARVVKAVVTIAARVISRFVKGRDHGLHATVVEEILRELYLANVGELIWSTMKKDTADAFAADGSVYGGTALLESLAQDIQPGAPPRITLIGHSTGAIYISHFLDKAAALLPPGQQFEIVFLAPASTCELTAATLHTHAARISHFRLFAMTDDYERADQLVRVLYPHSLLYFVSGVVEGGSDVPLVGMARYYDPGRYADAAFPQVKAVRDYVGAAADRAVWSVDGGGADGRRSTSEHHGEFDNDGVTLDSLAHILDAGF